MKISLFPVTRYNISPYPRALVVIFIIIGLLIVYASCDKPEDEPNGEEPEPVTPKEVSVTTFRRSSSTDLEMIQKTVDYASANKIPVVTVPDGVYEIDATTGVALKDNIQLRLSKGTVIKALPTDRGNYNVIKVHNAANVKITGGTIQGERDEHLGTGGEWGMGIDIRNSRNVELNDLSIIDCWGDAVYIAAGNGKSQDIIINNIVCNNNRRQGISVIQVDGLTVKNSVLKNTNGTGPAAGIDLEPNNQQELVTNVLIDSCSFIGNQGLGIHMYGRYGPVKDILVTNCIVDNNPIGVSTRYEGVAQVEMRNLKITNSANQSLRVFDGSKDVTISNVEINQSGRNGITIADADNVTFAGFSLDGFSTDGVLINNSSNVTLENFIFKNPTSTAIPVRITSSEKISVTGTEITGGRIGVSATGVVQLSFSNSTVKGQAEDGVFLSSSHDGAIKDNTFNQVAMFPIRLSSSNKNMIHGNSFSDNCHLLHDAYSQVYFLGASNQNEFYNNTVLAGSNSNKAKYAVWLTSTTQLNKIYNNNIDSDSFHSAAIRDESGNNQVE